MAHCMQAYNTVDLSTSYLGLKLGNPLILGASPLVDHLDLVRRAEDSGAAAIVMRSLFEEQLSGHPVAARNRSSFALGPDEYLEQLRAIKTVVAVPVVGSLNGLTRREWLRYAAVMQAAGADAIELNLYHLGMDPGESSNALEERLLDMVREVKSCVTVPLAIKLSPFFTSFAHFAVQLDEAGADGLVLFNRVYQPDIDPERLELVKSIGLSTPSDLLLRLVWVAALSGRVRASLAVTGGVHMARHVVKAVMAGAHAVQLVSAILQRGPEYFGVVRDELERWLEDHGYDSLAQVQGCMNLLSSAAPTAHERAGYADVLQSWRPPLRGPTSSAPPAH